MCIIQTLHLYILPVLVLLYYLQISEFPSERRITQDEIDRIELLSGKNDARLYILLQDGTEYFINEAEIGSSSFQEINTAV